MGQTPETFRIILYKIMLGLTSKLAIMGLDKLTRHVVGRLVFHSRPQQLLYFLGSNVEVKQAYWQ